MRSILLSLCVSALALAAGCGGGGAGDGVLAGKPSLGGGVTAVDGSTADLAGVALVLQQTGERAVSGADGRFRFSTSPTGTVVLEVGDDNPSSDDDAGDDAGDDSGEDDAVERTGTRIEIRDVRGGERIELRLRLQDGRLERVDIARSSSSGGGELEVEVDMLPGPDADDPGMRGEVELESEPEGEEFEVEVEHAAPGRALRVVVIDPSGAEEDLGVRTVNAVGEAEWERETEDGQTLPFGVAGVADLVGYIVQVRDADTGAVLLVVEVPELPTLPVGDDDDDDDDADDDSDDDDSDDDGDDDSDDDDDSSDDD